MDINAMHPALSVADDAVLVIVDVQTAFVKVIDDMEAVAETTVTVLRAAKRLGIPIVVTEQYPKGLGATIPLVASHLEGITPLEKTAFSCMRGYGFQEALVKTGRRDVVLTGIETHVCVLQTALDLCQEEFRVHLVEDAVASRYPRDKERALGLMAAAGVAVTTAESLLFQWLGDARHEAFRDIQRLIK